MLGTRVKAEICGAWRNSDRHIEKSLIDLIRIKETAEEFIDICKEKRFVFQVTEKIRSVEEWV